MLFFLQNNTIFTITKSSFLNIYEVSKYHIANFYMPVNYVYV